MIVGPSFNCVAEEPEPDDDIKTYYSLGVESGIPGVASGIVAQLAGSIGGLNTLLLEDDEERKKLFLGNETQLKL
jgi:hypothetical protein